MTDLKVLDQATLVDKNDQVIGQMDKVEAHLGQGQLHRAISVYLFRQVDDQVQLLIQQRSRQKIVGSLQWANTVCGNVWPIENYLECAKRRLKPVTKFQYQVRCNPKFSENEIDQVFAGWYDDRVTLNPDEVSDFMWLNWPDLLLALNNGQMQKYGQAEINVFAEGLETEIILAPWLVVMLKNQQVVNKLETFLTNNKI